MKIDIKNLEKSEIEINGILEVALFEKYEDKALEKIGGRLELQGFRKGKAPTSVIKENVSEMEILEEMAEIALSDNYGKILEDNKINAIGRPQISITKIAKGNDLEFKIVTAVLPEMKLPDYKKIAKDKNISLDVKKEIVVDEKEVEKVILDLRKMRAEQNKHDTNPQMETSDTNKDNHQGHEHMTEDEHIEFHKKDSEKNKEIPESDWPAFDDDFAKSFGEFKSADELKEKIKNNLKMEKEIVEKDKKRVAIIEELVKQTEGEIPDILIQSETDKIMYRLQADITNAGIKFEDYLKQINKTEEDLRKDWQKDAERNAKLQMIIHNISQKENLKATEEEIERDVTQITTMYKDADPLRARAYVEQMLQNEKVFAFLEMQK
jgi:trigger factor